MKPVIRVDRLLILFLPRTTTHFLLSFSSRLFLFLLFLAGNVHTFTILFIALSSRLRFVETDVTFTSRDTSVSPTREEVSSFLWCWGGIDRKALLHPPLFQSAIIYPRCHPEGFRSYSSTFASFVYPLHRESCDQTTVGDPVYQKIQVDRQVVP